MRIKVMYLVLCLTLLLSIISVTLAEAEIMPCYAYTSSIAATLNISGGSAQAAGKIMPEDGQRTAIIVRLQRENSNGSWITLAIWTGSNASGKSEAGGTKAIASGYNYRVYVTGKVYNDAGVVIESVDKYSATKSY